MPKTAEYDFDMIRRADHFLTSVFLGVGNYHTEKFADLAAAREGAKRMAAEINNGRRGMIYAVTPEGRSTFVPNSYQPEALTEGESTMTTETNLTAKEVAQLTAVITGGGYKRAKSKEAAIKRFVSLCQDNGIAAPRTFLALDSYETAKADLVCAIRGEDQGGDAMEIAKTIASAKNMTKEQVADEVLSELRKPAEAPKAAKPRGKRAEIQAAAERGEMPAAPDFSAKTHTRFRPKLAQVVELAEAGDLKGLKAFEINPVSSSPKAIAKYRDLCVTALEAQSRAA